MPSPTHCPKGHEYDEVNTRWQVRQNGHKTPTCRACQRIRVNNNIAYHNEYMKKWRAANPERNNKNWTDLRIKKREWVDNYKAKRGCSNCPERDPVCLDFHHRDPTQKEMTISLGIARASLERLQMEIAKCDILCANCHRKFHAATRPHKGLPERQD